MAASLELRRFHTVETFYNRVAPFLLQREAEHNLILGICANLMRYPERIKQQPYLATVEQEGRVVAAALMTPPNNLVLSHTDVPDTLSLFASDLQVEYGTLPAVVASTPFGKAFAEEWHRLSGQPYDLHRAERIYKLEKVNPVGNVPGHFRKAEASDRDLLIRWFVTFNKEALGETGRGDTESVVDRFLNSETQGVYLWEDGQTVSMAGHNRPTPNGVCVVAVYTPPEHRKKGYASACVAALSQTLLSSGRQYCFLYTDLANPTSNRIYEAIGYNPVCDAEMYRFGAVVSG